MTTRTQDQIVVRVREIRAGGNDWLGFREEVLLDALDFDHARPLLTPGITREQWQPQADTQAQARRYLEFAIEKILDHRSNSAGRSVVKLGEFAWLLGRDYVVSAMDAAAYPMYGAPKVQAFAEGFGWPFHDAVENLDDRRALARMAQGLQCHADGCVSGCAD